MMKKISWVLQGLLAAAFLFSGGIKLVGNPVVHGHFELWGYPDWFCYAVGAVEALGAIALWTPLALPACAILGLTMVGAVVTHLSHNEAPEALPPVILFGVLCGLMWVKRKAAKQTSSSAGGKPKVRAA